MGQVWGIGQRLCAGADSIVDQHPLWEHQGLEAIGDDLDADPNHPLIRDARTGIDRRRAVTESSLIARSIASEVAEQESR